MPGCLPFDDIVVHPLRCQPFGYQKSLHLGRQNTFCELLEAVLTPSMSVHVFPVKVPANSRIIRGVCRICLVLWCNAWFKWSLFPFYSRPNLGGFWDVSQIAPYSKIATTFLITYNLGDV